MTIKDHNATRACGCAEEAWKLLRSEVLLPQVQPAQEMRSAAAAGLEVLCACTDVYGELLYSEFPQAIYIQLDMVCSSALTIQHEAGNNASCSGGVRLQRRP
eukprot:TRINITY_DN4967_c0_g1_i1.p3 TRINITY_DN4967_c0_g1~~TRINITY_DN4967_c0_g1_i1.p3  ORF type:complete len:102 (+),score=25.01 TRINITY_DN4967_c0_g1_i1:630-935(+)